jgi:hypothetical protein
MYILKYIYPMSLSGCRLLRGSLAAKATKGDIDDFYLSGTII